MPKFLQQRWHGYLTVWVILLLLLLIIALACYNWELAVIGLLLSSMIGIVLVRVERTSRNVLSEYISNLSFRVKKIEGEVIHTLPFGIILYREDRVVEWANKFATSLFVEQPLIGEPLLELFPQLSGVLQVRKDTKEVVKEHQMELQHDGRFYHFRIVPDERLIYLFENTELAVLREKYESERLAIGIVLLDNLDEASQSMDDQQRTALIAKVSSEITSWAKQYGVYLRRLSSERYLMMLSYKSLAELELSRFVILDTVREMTADLKVPLTLSIGLAFGAETISELGELAQSSLDMALGRGGDQAAVKSGQRLSFYGGKSNAVEKRTRVRARVISHALRDLMQESDQVIILGHKNPDMDAIGAAIGVWKAASLFNVDACIVLDKPNPSITRLIEQVMKEEELAASFISPEQAMQQVTPHTLLIVVDTHKASMTMEPRLVKLASRIVVVDHHRRGEEFINDAVLIYMEPYASSACELVTELLQYIHDRVQFTPLEATALLAGIAVDTKHFSLHTGSRTFEAAGFLRRSGADTVMIQRLLKEDLDEYIAKAEIIKHAKMLHGHIALAVTEPGRQIPQLSIAQVADTLLNMTDVLASFVVSERPDGLVGISARSLGRMNVQVVMERLGGGGHLTNAAVQLDCTLEEAERRLGEVLAEIEAEEGLFE